MKDLVSILFSSHNTLDIELHGRVPHRVLVNMGFALLITPLGTLGIVLLMQTNVFEQAKFAIMLSERFGCTRPRSGPGRPAVRCLLAPGCRRTPRAGIAIRAPSGPSAAAG